MKRDINKQKLIYFYSLNGTWIRINKNLAMLGLDRNKIVKNTYLRDFKSKIENNIYMDYYNDIDVLIIDEFYSHEFNDNITFDVFYEAIKELVEKGIQIVMAGLLKMNALIGIPKERKKEIVSYKLKYNLKNLLEYKVEYI